MFKLLQITDTHLFADPEATLLGVNTRQSLEAVLNEINRRAISADAVLLTGDLIQDDEAASYDVLLSYLEKLPWPIYWIPGNHDVDALLEGRFQGDNIRDEKHIESEHWQVILLDSRRPERVEGFLAAEELHRLERLLQTHQKHALVVLHHHPVSINCQWIDPLGLENAAEFWSIIDAHAHVKAVLWGHIHQDFAAQRNNVRLLASPSTSIQFKPQSKVFALDDLPPGCRLVLLGEDGGIHSEVIRPEKFEYQYDPNATGY